LILYQILNCVQSLIDLADVHEWGEQPSLELPLAKGRLAIVHVVKERAFHLALGVFYHFQMLQGL
jgi:hypothetical protein